MTGTRTASAIHLHTPLFMTEGDGERQSLINDLATAEQAALMVRDLMNSRSYDWPEDNALVRVKAASLRARWFDDLRPRMVAELHRFGIQPTGEIIPCINFAMGGSYRRERICMSWASDDTAETFTDLWDHMVAFHGSQQRVNWDYADRLTAATFTRYKIVTGAVE